MKTNELVFFLNPRTKMLFAARPKTGSAISLSNGIEKWEISHYDLYQLSNASAYDGYDDLTPEKAKAIYGDVLPDAELLDKQDRIKNSRKKPTNEVSIP